MVIILKILLLLLLQNAESAYTDKAWRGAGQEVGLQIWRIVKFKVTHWNREDYGKFYTGDSYIVLNTYKKKGSDELLYDVHFWIGQYSTQDEYGTAAYKTVELDKLLDYKPVQHREVQGHESDLFKSYFKEMTLMEGGAGSGFKHIKPTEYTTRLLHFKGTRGKVLITEDPVSMSSLDSSDVFILDKGLRIYQWNGKKCSRAEKFKAVQVLQTLKSERGGKPRVESLNEREISPDHEFYASLADEEGPSEKKTSGEDFENKLLRLSDSTGKLQLRLIAEGSIVTKDLLDSSDVFILDTSKELFVWIGKSASKTEKKYAKTHAHNYLMKTKHPLIPVTVLSEVARNQQDHDKFNMAIAA